MDLQLWWLKCSTLFTLINSAHYTATYRPIGFKQGFLNCQIMTFDRIQLSLLTLLYTNSTVGNNQNILNKFVPFVRLVFFLFRCTQIIYRVVSFVQSKSLISRAGGTVIKICRCDGLKQCKWTSRKQKNIISATVVFYFVHAAFVYS